MEHALLNDESEWSLASDRAPFWVGEKKEGCLEFCVFQHSIPMDLQLQQTGRNTGFFMNQ